GCLRPGPAADVADRDRHRGPEEIRRRTRRPDLVRSAHERSAAVPTGELESCREREGHAGAGGVRSAAAGPLTAMAGRHAGLRCPARLDSKLAPVKQVKWRIPA